MGNHSYKTADESTSSARVTRIVMAQCLGILSWAVGKLAEKSLENAAMATSKAKLLDAAAHDLRIVARRAHRDVFVQDDRLEQLAWDMKVLRDADPDAADDLEVRLHIALANGEFSVVQGVFPPRAS